MYIRVLAGEVRTVQVFIIYEIIKSNLFALNIKQLFV